MPRPRSTKATRFEPNEPGAISYQKKELLAETYGIVNYTGNVFIGREFKGEKVKVLILRE
jgi:hypothetical protein